MIATAIDRYVGLKLKVKRSEMGITQGELGYMTGVTFQQIQKYEKGQSKIVVSKLCEFADVLNVPVNYFFKGHDTERIIDPDSLRETKTKVYDADSLDTNSIVKDKEAITLLKFFSKIKNKKTRKSILNLTKTLSSEEQKCSDGK